MPEQKKQTISKFVELVRKHPKYFSDKLGI